MTSSNEVPAPVLFMQSASPSANSALDQLTKVITAFSAVAALTAPADNLHNARREDIGMLLALIDEHEAVCSTRTQCARTAVVDLIGSGRGMDCAMREHLHALMELLALLQQRALAGLSAS